VEVCWTYTPVRIFFLKTRRGHPNQMNMAPADETPFDPARGDTIRCSSLTIEVLRELPQARLVFACPNPGMLPV
jgi:hypothetical protein